MMGFVMVVIGKWSKVVVFALELSFPILWGYSVIMHILQTRESLKIEKEQRHQWLSFLSVWRKLRSIARERTGTGLNCQISVVWLWLQVQHSGSNSTIVATSKGNVMIQLRVNMQPPTQEMFVLLFY